MCVNHLLCAMLLCVGLSTTICYRNVGHNVTDFLGVSASTSPLMQEKKQKWEKRSRSLHSRSHLSSRIKKRSPPEDVDTSIHVSDTTSYDVVDSAKVHDPFHVPVQMR